MIHLSFFRQMGKHWQTHAGMENIRLWDVQTHKHKATLAGRGKLIQFLSDGKTLVCAGGDIQLWDAHTLKLKDKFTFTEDFENFASMVFSPDGTNLVLRASQSNRGETLYVWDLESGEHKG